jgi:fatty-acyl-CoA synthase
MSPSSSHLPYRQELSPIHFLERAGVAYADRVAVTDGETRYTWRALRQRARRMASALRSAGVRDGDRVAILAFNSEPMLLAHFGVPMMGGVLVAINTRLSTQEVAYIVDHSGSRVVIVSPELLPMLADVPPHVRRIVIGDELETLIATGVDAPVHPSALDEYDSIAINYTSGTTGRPKGVLYHHRGAHLNALAMALDHQLRPESRYLWTLPMFHCNGWTFTWALAAVGAESVCLPKVDPARVWQLLDDGVTHFCGAPTVLTMLANDPAAHVLERPVRVFVAGAPPSPTILAEMTRLGFHVDHTYGLTETYGPFTMNVAQPGEDARPEAERAQRRARQGVPNPVAGEVRVVDTEMNDVPPDAATMGEVVFRGNAVMKGYFADENATDVAFKGGWFHSGDVGVLHPDGWIELRDRSKDVIISGGENISTIEVEQAVVSHPSVLECAVIGIPDEKWGEVAKAFVALKPGKTATADEIVAHVRGRIAHFKAPKQVAFGDLPKTSTGKIQKFVLREMEWKGMTKRIH